MKAILKITLFMVALALTIEVSAIETSDPNKRLLATTAKPTTSNTSIKTE